MLAKKYRLKNEAEIKEVLKRGRFFKNKYLRIKVQKNDADYSRFATPVGLKVSKKAVTRNKIKRRLQEILRTNWDDIKSGYNVLVMVEAPIKNKEYQQIEQALLELLSQAKLMKDTD